MSGYGDLVREVIKGFRVSDLLVVFRVFGYSR